MRSKPHGLVAAGLAGACAVAAAAWMYRSALVEAWQRWGAAPEAPSARDAGVRKCLVGGQILYANSACPPGSHEQPLGGGSVNVVKMPRAAPEPTARASGLPNVRDLLIDRGGGDLMDKRIEQMERQ